MTNKGNEIPMGISLLSLHIKNRTIRRVAINVGDAKRREGGDGRDTILNVVR